MDAEELNSTANGPSRTDQESRLDDDALRERTKRLIKNHGTSQAFLAERLGVKRQRLNAFLQGKTRRMHASIMESLKHLVEIQEKLVAFPATSTQEQPVAEPDDASPENTADEEHAALLHGDSTLAGMRREVIRRLGSADRVFVRSVMEMDKEQFFRFYAKFAAVFGMGPMPS